MSAQIKQLFAEYLLEAKDPLAAAVLTLADRLRCRCVGGRVRIPLDEIERYEAQA